MGVGGVPQRDLEAFGCKGKAPVSALLPAGLTGFRKQLTARKEDTILADHTGAGRQGFPRILHPPRGSCWRLFMGGAFPTALELCQGCA